MWSAANPRQDLPEHQSINHFDQSKKIGKPEIHKKLLVLETGLYFFGRNSCDVKKQKIIYIIINYIILVIKFIPFGDPTLEDRKFYFRETTKIRLAYS